jgi:hypothetical protein
VASFTGSAFQVDAKRKAQPLLVLGEDVGSLMPTVAWQWDSKTPRVPVGGRYQGAALRVGEGRVAAFGGATMFTAQLVGPERRHTTRMNSPVAQKTTSSCRTSFTGFLACRIRLRRSPTAPSCPSSSPRSHGAPILDEASELT